MALIDEIPDTMAQVEGGPIDWMQYSSIASGSGTISLPSPLGKAKRVTVGYLAGSPAPRSVTYTVGGTSGKLESGNKTFTIPANDSLQIDYDIGEGARIFISWGLPS